MEISGKSCNEKIIKAKSDSNKIWDRLAIWWYEDRASEIASWWENTGYGSKQIDSWCIIEVVAIS